ncbi:MAG: hypothetical protein ABSD67_11065 [Terracidiphilus sp.]|jgi:hypothetical protein
MNATASILTDGYSGPVLVRPVSAEEENRLNEVPRVDGNFLRGIAIALGMEAVGGMCFFFIWQIGHLIR